MEIFYPPEIQGYHELRFHSQHFNTVENNSSFYRIAKESTYKTWYRMTPDAYKFSLKLNRLITHNYRLEMREEVMQAVNTILTSTQILQNKLGAIVIQLPPSFRCDPGRLGEFGAYFKSRVQAQPYHFDVAIEFRHKSWFTEEVYSLLREQNIALVAGQSSRYPEVRHLTADIAYIRMHGPEQLFASKYSHEQLEEWATYIRDISLHLQKVYVYFNNDFHGYALENAKELAHLLAMREAV
jgi:uncharacterized protein YecE (DUF72 family)